MSASTSRLEGNKDIIQHLYDKATTAHEGSKAQGLKNKLTERDH